MILETPNLELEYFGHLQRIKMMNSTMKKYLLVGYSGFFLIQSKNYKPHEALCQTKQVLVNNNVRHFISESDKDPSLLYTLLFGPAFHHGCNIHNILAVIYSSLHQVSDIILGNLGILS